jgi:hypothetical protein
LFGGLVDPAGAGQAEVPTKEVVEAARETLLIGI